MIAVLHTSEETKMFKDLKNFRSVQNVNESPNIFVS